ncbi:MAG: MFS transporter [Propionibacteriaceae bacterium]
MSSGSADPATTPSPGRSRIGVLVASQLLAGVGVASGIAVGGLLAERLSGTTAFAGFAQTAAVLGAGVWAIPLARLAGRRDRRWGLGVGYMLAAVGVVMIFTAVATQVVPLLFLGFGFFGAATAAGLQARFAATETVSLAYRARAMSFVLWATTLGSVAGPNLSQVGSDLGRRLGLEPLTGPYLFSFTAFALAAAVIGIGLRPVATSGTAPAASGVAPLGLLAALRGSLRNPVTVLAVVAITCSHTVMVGVMVMTPVHMFHDGFSLSLVGLVISFHVLGMYGASPLFGWLTDKVSARGVVLVAVVVFAAALAVAASSGTARFVPMSVALGLLGLGWSAGMIGGSTLLTESVPVGSRTSMQGATDAIMNLAAAGSSALSGVVMDLAGFPALGVIAGVVVLPMAVLAVRFGEAERATRSGVGTHVDPSNS